MAKKTSGVSPSKEQKVLSTTKPVAEVESKEYYDTEGRPFKEEPNNCCGKKVHTENGTDLCYLKMNTSEELYHPTKNKSHKHLHYREMGKNYWGYKKVKKTTFDMYMSFLRTKNEIFFGNASRSLM